MERPSGPAPAGMAGFDPVSQHQGQAKKQSSSALVPGGHAAYVRRRGLSESLRPTLWFPSLREAIRLGRVAARIDRKSTRLNSSHANNSYSVLCLKKKKR